MANLVIEIATVRTLQQTYAARGSAWEDLARQLGERRVRLEAELADAHKQRTAAVLAVFDWIEAQFAGATERENANAMEWLREHQADIDALDRSIDEQKALLLDALRKVAPPSAYLMAPSGPAAATLPGAPAIPPLPGPALEARIAALRARRARLVGFVLQNTEAIVKSAARRQSKPMEPVFTRPSAALPDRTELFRPFVVAPTASIRSLTEHGNL
jgi:hypothetical protein